MVKTWLKHKTTETKATLATLCKNPTSLKRAPLPISVAWNGKSGMQFKNFIDKFHGHVAQQSHMGYLLHDATALLWMKHGNAEIVLRFGMAQHIHTSMHYITPSQFLNDIVWLYGAIQQAITGMGRNIVRKFELTQDGLLAWKRFVKMHQYN